MEKPAASGDGDSGAIGMGAGGSELDRSWHGTPVEGEPLPFGVAAVLLWVCLAVGHVHVCLETCVPGPDAYKAV